MYKYLGIILLLSANLFADSNFDALKSEYNYICKYKVVKKGSGKRKCLNFHTPIVRYKISSNLNPKSIDQKIDISEIKSPFKKAIVGMKEGEIRKIILKSPKSTQAIIEIELLELDNPYYDGDFILKEKKQSSIFDTLRSKIIR
jgi:hypothetical protein